MILYIMTSWKGGRREKKNNGREEEGKDGRGRQKDGERNGRREGRQEKKMKERFILNLKNYCETAAEGNSKKKKNTAIKILKKTNEKWL